MGDILEQLKQGHQKLSTAIECIEIELDRLRDNNAVEHLSLLQDAIEYMAAEPALTHRPLQSEIYILLQSKPLECLQEVQWIMAEHGVLAEKTHLLKYAVEQANQANAIDEHNFIEAGYEYINVHRTHMESEESVIFPLVEKHFDDSDWDRLNTLSQSLSAQAQEESGPLLALFDKISKSVKLS